MSEINNILKTDFPASIIKRGVAFLIDSFISALPIIAICAIILQSFPADTLLLSPAPVLGIFTIYDMPFEVSDELNVVENEDGTHFEVGRNLSFSATSIRICAFLSLVFYVLYTTLCTYLYGKTIGKRLMRIEVYHEGELKPIFWTLLRETLGKTLLNSTIIIPAISLILVLVTPTHKAVHDFIGNTMVVESF